VFESRVANLIFTVILLLAGLSWEGVEGTDFPPTAAAALGGIRVTVSAPYSSISWDERDAARERFDLPLLYLHRQRQATGALERTLTLQISGLPAGSELQLEAVSQHVDVSTGKPHTMSALVVTPDRPCTTEHPCSISWALDRETPSDLYYLRVKGRYGRTLWENAPTDRPAFAALDTWDVPVRTDRTPHYTVRVIYGTLFPFARGKNDLPDRLAPAQVTDFIAGTFVPIIRETWHTQAEEWGWGEPLHPEWDTDGILEVVVTDPPFALLDGTGTYTRLSGSDGRPYPHRRIWWFSSSNSFQAYDSLKDGYKAMFAHEFFHTMQWNVLLLAGSPTDLWISWLEAQAAFAPTVQYPGLELRRDHLALEGSAYTSVANRFLERDLNASFSDLERDRGKKYDGALYWRFLYEQYGGMDVARAALTEMARQTNSLVGIAMDRALDAALARLDGPFHSFEESLIAFARANYALRLTNGRCASPDLATCGGLYYDPQAMYASPSQVAQVSFDGSKTTYYGAIPSSIGVDYLEVRLARNVHNRPLMIRLRRENRLSRFHVQVWKVGPGLSGLRAVDLQPRLAWQEPDGTYVYGIPRVQTLEYDRVVLIITRLDTYPTGDASGNYRVTVESTG
jgi:hypothetical protein